ncbi:MAG: asparagine synthase-related protein, partial [Chloroflexota bacterium]
MSAIVGMGYRDGRPVDPGVFGRMMKALAHRGDGQPDVWPGESVMLGAWQQRLQPGLAAAPHAAMQEAGPFVAVVDARLDNRVELLDALDLDRQPSDVLSDAALVLAAYARWGAACPDRLLGDFAFAIWDRRERQLFCARDHAGVKPFYFATTPDTVAFATEASPLLLVPGVSGRPDDAQIADYLTGDLDDPAATFFAGVRRLPPGHALVADASGTRTWAFWTPDAKRELALASDTEYEEAFRAVFTEAVRCRLQDAGPVGAMLSGGLDSSAIACVAAGLRPDDAAGGLPVFSCVFDDAPECDERHYQQLVVRSGRFSPVAVAVDDISPLATFGRLLRQTEGPPFGPGLYSQVALYQAARSSGVT